jgi:L-asparaginase / beta-aspartyl-peptidase
MDRRQGLLEAIRRGADILRQGGHALDAVIAAVMVLEDDPLFNAGYGSVLSVNGTVEMDAGVMAAEQIDGNSEPPKSSRRLTDLDVAGAYTRAGGVVMITRVRNPILLARIVMERTPHVLMGGSGAEAIARREGIRLCRPGDLISERARQRWLAREREAVRNAAEANGTVGAVALDRHGNLASATSTGGMGGKLPGRIGDSAILGAGFFANGLGAASSTGTGEAILRMAPCREAVRLIERREPARAAAQVIHDLREATDGEAGLIAIDWRGRIGFAHNAAAMEIAMLETTGSVKHLAVRPL